MFGGNDGNTFFNEIYILNPHAAVASLSFYNWSTVAYASTSAPPPLSHVGGFMHNNTLWIYGGLAAHGIVHSTLWSFDFASKWWTHHPHDASAGHFVPRPCYGGSLVFIAAFPSITA
jgi:hypothetical protein